MSCSYDLMYQGAAIIPYLYAQIIVRSIRSTKLGFIKRGFGGDNWIKPKKNKTNAKVLENTCN